MRVEPVARNRRRPRPDRRERLEGAGELGGRVARRKGCVKLAPRCGQRVEARLGWRIILPVSFLGTAVELIERLVRAPLLLLDGDVLLRLDRLAARRDGGGDGDGLPHLDHGRVALRLAGRATVATFDPLRLRGPLARCNNMRVVLGRNLQVVPVRACPAHKKGRPQARKFCRNRRSQVSWGPGGSGRERRRGCSELCLKSLLRRSCCCW